MGTIVKSVQFQVSQKIGEVSGVLLLPGKAEYFLMFAHGAGAGMGHVFMERMAESLANEHIATLRFNFPYTEKGSKRPDHAPVLIETIQAAYKIAQENAIGIPILAGGKSMGGRMTSMAASMGLLSGIKGVAFFGFPLHAPGKPSGDRAEHLYLINEPMLFLQGSKDKLADLALLKPVIAKLGSNAKLYVVEGADHSFHLPKSSGRTDEDVFRELAKKVKEWADEIKQ